MKMCLQKHPMNSNFCIIVTDFPYSLKFRGNFVMERRTCSRNYISHEEISREFLPKNLTLPEVLI